MGVIRAQVFIPSDTGIVADGSVNVFHFASLEDDPVVVSGYAHTKLTAFYQAIDGILASTCNTPATVKYYDLEDPEPRVPVAQDTIALTLPSSSGLPAECAIVLGFQGAPTSGVNQARRRGRVFIGPLDSGIVTTSSGRTLVSAATVTTLSNAGANLLDAISPTEASLAVFSPTSAGAPPWSPGAIDGATTVADEVWVDNAFDTQRRRGILATSRTTLP